jgi:hypothetical protein
LAWLRFGVVFFACLADFCTYWLLDRAPHHLFDLHGVRTTILGADDQLVKNDKPRQPLVQPCKNRSRPCVSLPAVTTTHRKESPGQNKCCRKNGQNNPAQDGFCVEKSCTVR